MEIIFEPMTVAESAKGGDKLEINYSFSTTPFGTAIIASTAKGICGIELADDAASALDALPGRFPNASFANKTDERHTTAAACLNGQHAEQLTLHLRGTEFQFKVWQALLDIPAGQTASYASLAAKLGIPGACRAVGTAIGRNPVAVIIPCHRAVHSSGKLGKYHWGNERKKAILASEGL